MRRSEVYTQLHTCRLNELHLRFPTFPRVSPLPPFEVLSLFLGLPSQTCRLLKFCHLIHVFLSFLPDSGNRRFANNTSCLHSDCERLDAGRESIGDSERDSDYWLELKTDRLISFYILQSRLSAAILSLVSVNCSVAIPRSHSFSFILFLPFFIPISLPLFVSFLISHP